MGIILLFPSCVTFITQRHKWNRQRAVIIKASFPIYGKEIYFFLFGQKGFREYQLILPYINWVKAIKAISELINKENIKVSLGSLKIFKGSTGLDYSAHPTALDKLQEVCDRVTAEYDVQALAAVHRTGTLAIGDIAVIVATASAHRGTAFDASRALIDTLKDEVPIWKHQRFGDGTEEWVGSP